MRTVHKCKIEIYYVSFISDAAGLWDLGGGYDVSDATGGVGGIE